MSVFNSAAHPLRGDVERGDLVMCEMPTGQPPAEGQVVAETPGGGVTVAIFDGTVEREFERYRVWKAGYELEEL